MVREYPQSSDRHPKYFSFTSMHATCLFMHLVGNLADSLMCSRPSVMDLSSHGFDASIIMRVLHPPFSLLSYVNLMSMSTLTCSLHSQCVPSIAYVIRRWGRNKVRRKSDQSQKSFVHSKATSSSSNFINTHGIDANAHADMFVLPFLHVEIVWYVLLSFDRCRCMASNAKNDDFVQIGHLVAVCCMQSCWSHWDLHVCSHDGLRILLFRFDACVLSLESDN
jgi:hypothetical protein